MNINIKYIFVFIFIFSVFSLTLQASVISFCKESKILKAQSQNPISEEEDESNDSDEEVDELFYLNHEPDFINPQSLLKLNWPKEEFSYVSFTKSIPIPPPRH